MVLFVSIPSFGSLEDSPRSVAILPSALVVEHHWLGASWAFLVSVGAATWMSLSGSALADQEPDLCRSHPNSAIFFGIPTYQNGLGCASNQLAAVTERVVDFAADPQFVQQHRQLSRHRHDRSLLGLLAASFRHLQTPAA
jgi:hypothetical protein